EGVVGPGEGGAWAGARVVPLTGSHSIAGVRIVAGAASTNVAGVRVVSGPHVPASASRGVITLSHTGHIGRQGIYVYCRSTTSTGRSPAVRRNGRALRTEKDAIRAGTQRRTPERVVRHPIPIAGKCVYHVT